MHYLISLICVLATAAAVSAAEITVDCQSCKQTKHYCDIQSAINAASAGDVVVLVSGNSVTRSSATTTQYFPAERF